MADLQHDDRVIKAIKEHIGYLFQFVFMIPIPEFKLNSLRAILSMIKTLAKEFHKTKEYEVELTMAKQLLDNAEIEQAKSRLPNQAPQLHYIRIYAGDAQDILMDIARKERWIIMDTNTLGNLMHMAQGAGASLPVKTE